MEVWEVWRIARGAMTPCRWMRRAVMVPVRRMRLPPPHRPLPQPCRAHQQLQGVQGEEGQQGMQGWQGKQGWQQVQGVQGVGPWASKAWEVQVATWSMCSGECGGGGAGYSRGGWRKGARARGRGGGVEETGGWEGRGGKG